MVLWGLAAGALMSSTDNLSVNKATTMTEVVNNFMMNMDTSLTNEQESRLSLDQTMNIRAPGMVMQNCSLDISQAQMGTLASTLQNFNDLSEEQSAELANSLSASQAAVMEQVNSGLNFGDSSNEMDNEQLIQNDIKNNLKMNISKTFENMNLTEADGGQTLNIDLTGLYCMDSDLVIDQAQVMEIVASNVSENILDTLQEGSALNDITTEQTSEMSQANEGLSASGSSGSSSSIVIVAGIIGLAAKLMPMEDEEGGGSGVPEDPGVSEGEQGGGGGVLGMPWSILVVGLIAIAATVYILWILYDKYIPKLPCPTLEDCEEGWTKLNDQVMKDPQDYITYENCRFSHLSRDRTTPEHVVQLIKPAVFRPRCETYCGLTHTLQEKHGITNPFQGLLCIGSSDEDEVDAAAAAAAAAGGDESTTTQSASVETDIDVDQS